MNALASILLGSTLGYIACGMASASTTKPLVADALVREISIAADQPGNSVSLEFIANVSRLPPLIGVSDSADLRRKFQDPEYPEALRASIRARYPAADRIRVGNLFFGYSCTDYRFQELVARDANGNLTYQFDETLDMLEMLVRAGSRPVLALTGTPRELIPDGEPVEKHRSYGCTNAPRLHFRSEDPRQRAADWWHLQHAFFESLRKRFGDDELAKWEFATWTEPVNRQRRSHGHLLLPKAILDADMHDDAVATILAASIDAAISSGVKIHIGNFAGNVEVNYPPVIQKIRQFPRGQEYLDYILGYAISRYRTKSGQSIERSLDRAMKLERNQLMPAKPIFLDEVGQLVDDSGARLPKAGTGLAEASFIGTVLERLYNAQLGQVSAPARVALWNTSIAPRAADAVRGVDDYIPSATSNLIGFFKQLNAGRRLPVVGSNRDIVAVRKGDRVTFIALGPAISTSSSRHGSPGVSSVRITGLESSQRYLWRTEEINARHGNPVSAYLEGNSYLDDESGRFTIREGRWVFSSKRDARCFFDEIEACSWRDEGRRLAAPKLTERVIVSDEVGQVELPMRPEPGGAIFNIVSLLGENEG